MFQSAPRTAKNFLIYSYLNIFQHTLLLKKLIHCKNIKLDDAQNFDRIDYTTMTIYVLKQVHCKTKLDVIVFYEMR